MRPVALLLVLASMSMNVSADDFGAGKAEGYEFADSMSGYVQDLAKGSDSRASSYGGSTQISEQTHPCNQLNEQGVKTCGGQAAAGEDPSQYYGMSRAQLEDAARVKASTDDTAKFVLDAHEKRPQFEIKPEDPLFKHDAENQQNMVTLTNTYSGCANIKYGGEGQNTEKTCQKNGYRTNIDNTCRRTWTGTCNWVSAHKFEVQRETCTTVKKVTTCTYSPVSTSKSREQVEYYDAGNGVMGSRATTADYVHQDIGAEGVETVKWTVKMSSLTAKTTLFVQHVLWVADNDSKTSRRPTLTINGVDVPRSVSHSGVGGKRYRYYGAWANIRSYLREGENTVVLTARGGAIEVLKLANMAEVMECEQQFENAVMCSEGGAQGAEFVSSTCLDKQDRVIDGVTFKRDCWVQDEVYRRPGPAAFTEEPLCDQLRAQGCGTIGSTCTAWHPDGWCQRATVRMTCGAGQVETMQVCGESLSCADGNCYAEYHQPEPDNSRDFANAAAYLAAMEDMKREFDPTNITVWKGEYRTCKVKDSAIGGDRCCKGGTGFISTVGGGCDANEEAIAKAKEMERVSFIRSRKVCEIKVAGSCVYEVTYMDFCVWPSKLARIVQDQGRPMLGQVVDKPCPGFKLQDPNEFMGVNWNMIDMSDYFSDVQKQYNSVQKPDGQELRRQQEQSNSAIQNEYAEKYRQYYGN